MKIDSEQFNQYMLAKDALHKLADCATFGQKCELTREEVLALFSEKMIDLEAQRGMLE